jgi:single-strand DNA-binding protein
MQNITIAGNIGRDAEQRTAGQSNVTGFPVAVTSGFGDKKKTTWFDCNLWGNRGEKLAQYLTKGGKVAVSGELGTREGNDGKTYLSINVSEITLMGGKPDNGGNQGGYGGDNGNQGGGYGQGGAPAGGLEDDVPF